MTLVVQKGGGEVFRITDTGDITFQAAHREDASIIAAPGELAVDKAGGPVLDSQVKGGTRTVNLARRLHDHAVFPGVGLQIHRAGIQFAELSAKGDLYVRGNVATALSNPGQPGPFGFIGVVYAAPGLTYSALPAAMKAQYSAFTAPTPGFSTRSINVSDFGNIPAVFDWGFTSANVPINGLLRIPTGAGPFPVAIIVHGNHSQQENSTPGYGYLLDLLASHGILAASVDCNFLNGGNFGENDARAIVHLEHVRQLKIWSSTPGHPLQGKVDLSRILIAGHSRGGEGVGHASVFNRLSSVIPDPGDPPVPLDGSIGLGPYFFALGSVVAIAPTDGQYVPVTGPPAPEDPYFIVHGSRDGDVFDFQGQKTHDRAQPIDLANPTKDAAGYKSLLWLIGANHNHFNSVWATEGAPTITRPEQENVARVYLGAIAQATLLGRAEYLALLRDHRTAWNLGWIPVTIGLTSQYQDRRRIFADHYQHNNAALPSPPVVGSIVTVGLTATEQNLAAIGGSVLEETRAVKLVWTASGGRYRININAGTLPTDARQCLVLRCGLSTDPQNDPASTQDFTITVSDASISSTVAASSFIAPLSYPAQLAFGGNRVVMQTMRIPLQVFAAAGINVSDLRAVELGFDLAQSSSGFHQGSLYLDDIQLSE